MPSDEWNAKHVVLLDTIDCHAALSLEDATVTIGHVRTRRPNPDAAGDSVVLTRTELDEIAKAWLRYRYSDGQ